MKCYIMSIIVCLLSGLSYDLYNSSNMNICQDLGAIVFALAVGIIFGAVNNS